MFLNLTTGDGKKSLVNVDMICTIEPHTVGVSVCLTGFVEYLYFVDDYEDIIKAIAIGGGVRVPGLNEEV